MLFQRVVTAIVLLLLILVILIFGDKSVWQGFSVVLTLLAMWEYARLVKMQVKWRTVYLLASAILLWAVFHYHIFDRFPGLYLSLSVLLLLYWVLWVPLVLHKKIQLKAGILTVVAGWLMFISFGYHIAELFAYKKTVGIASLAQVNWNILYLILLVWVADISAYFVGKQLGKHKLAPEISPGKSVEGALGAMFVVVICSISYYVLLTGQLKSGSFSWMVCLVWIICSLLLTVLSILGDLFESWLKRCVHVKDSGKLLPGHGGVYDRVDSWISVLAMYPILKLILTYSL